MIALPTTHRRTVLSSAEMQVWLKLQKESWEQMQAIFPRLEAFNGPARSGTVRTRVPYKARATGKESDSPDSQQL